jgi:manganese-dependent inorganic pyrophosphatase
MRILSYFFISFYYINCVTPFVNLILENDKLKNEKKTTYIYGHINPDSDTIISSIVVADLQKKMGNTNNLVPCRLGELNKETQFVLNFFKVDAPMLITDLSGADEVILVDHNAPSQSLDFQNANIVGLIDHHAITGFETSNPIEIITKPVGCTCTILYELYKQHNITMTETIAGLMLSAIISDTLLLKSPITTQLDIEAVEFLSEYIRMDYFTYGRSMLIAGTDVSDLTEYQIIDFDSKNFKVNGYSIQIAFVNSVDVNSILKYRKGKLLEEMNKMIDNKNLQLFVLVIVDILEMDSTALVTGSYSYVVETAFTVEIVDNEVFLKGITSRKKEVYPNIANVLKDLPEYSSGTNSTDNADNVNNSHSQIKFNNLVYLVLLLLI